MVLAEEVGQQPARRVGVPRADADRTKEIPVSRVARDEPADPLPEQQQRAVVLLILDAHERPSELQGRAADPVEQRRVVAEQCPRVEAGDAARRDDRVCLADAVRASDAALVAIPQEQMLVPRVERVEIERPPGAFSDRAVRDLAEAADLAQRRWNPIGGGAEDLKGAALDERCVRRQRSDFVRDHDRTVRRKRGATGSVRLKPDTTEATVRLKPDTTEGRTEGTSSAPVVSGFSRTVIEALRFFRNSRARSAVRSAGCTRPAA